MLKIEQLLAGRDFARDDPNAAQMANFAYVIKDAATHRALLVDPAWDVAGLVQHLENEGYTLEGALRTHYHPDHVGGEVFGISIDRLARLARLPPAARTPGHPVQA